MNKTDMREYGIWTGIKARCYCRSASHYKNYGGRGITVCERWRESFEAFLDDMGPQPSELHTVDRIDNEGRYEPENCRWATRAEQAKNRRTNRRITAFGKTQIVADWAREYGMGYTCLVKRLANGMSPEEALTLPRQGEVILTAFGETHTLCEWAKLKGLKSGTLHNRLFVKKWPVEKALTGPQRQHKVTPLVTAFGETHTISEWARLRGMPADRLYRRIMGFGWDAERALSE